MTAQHSLFVGTLIKLLKFPLSFYNYVFGTKLELYIQEMKEPHELEMVQVVEEKRTPQYVSAIEFQNFQKAITAYVATNEQFSRQQLCEVNELSNSKTKEIEAQVQELKQVREKVEKLENMVKMMHSSCDAEVQTVSETNDITSSFHGSCMWSEITPPLSFRCSYKWNSTPELSTSSMM
jgi:23S rRNA pseudoU1915 N3-methylase RlmH